jgi:general secretion pathway protein D
MAPEDVHREIASQLAMNPAQNGINGARQPAASNGVTRFGLRHLTWQELEGYLRQTWGNQLRITEEQNGRVASIPIPTVRGEPTIVQIDRLNNMVHVFGTAGAQSSWRQLLEALDAARQPAETTRVMPVRNVETSRIQQAVTMLQDAASEARGGLSTTAIRLDGQAAAGGLFTVAPQEEAASGAQPPPVDPSQPPVDPNQPVDPLAGGEDSGLLGDVRIEFIPELGVIIIRGRQRDVERIRRLIDQIEEIGREVQPEVVIVPLRHVNSQSLGELVIELYDQVFAPRQGPLSITALDKPNALLLIGRAETMDVVQQLIRKLDQPVPPSTQLKVFHLQHISAVDAERLVQGFFVNQPSGTTGAGGAGTGEQRPGLGTRARVIAEYRSNSLVVQAAPRDLMEVAHFIQSIDRPSPTAEHEIRVFRLQHALAQELAPILQGAISGTAVTGGVQGQAPTPQGQGTTGQVSRPSTRLSIIGVDSAGNRIIDSGVLTDVTVSADANVNALLVRAPARSMNLVDELIRQLDKPPDVTAQIKVYEIQNGDATSLAQMLQGLFGQQVTAGQGALAQSLQQAFVGLTGATTATESSLVPLRFAVDVRTNAIIASGTAGDLAVVEVLLLRLDIGNVQTRNIFVYRLKNAPAQDVALAIQQFLASQQQLTSLQLQFGQAISPFEQIERDLIVVPELVSNSLIVSVTPRYREQVMKIIEDLDFRPPMVMVQVMICEVTLSDAFEMGVELGLQDSLIFDRSLATATSAVVPSATPSTVTAGTRETLAGQSVSNFSMGRSSASLGYGGLVLSAANESVNILVRALQDAGRLQVLSRPQVMTLDNQVAFVQVGARVPRIVGSNITPQGGVQNTTADSDVGLLLRIQPRINQDGLVVMNIDAENSSVGPVEQGIPVAIDNQGRVINSPQINTTTAQTTISAHSGQTVVFAGLISKNRSVQSRRVPFVSDIPILGRLFRFDAESNLRTELLIFMTPYIIKDDEDYDWIKFVESERMSWCLADVVEMHGDVGVSGGHGLWGPAPSPFIYPDVDPTGSEAIPAPRPASRPGEIPPPVHDSGSSRRQPQHHSARTTWTDPPPSQMGPLHKAPSDPTLAPSGPELGPSAYAPPWQQPNEQPPAVAPAGYYEPNPPRSPPLSGGPPPRLYRR